MKVLQIIGLLLVLETLNFGQSKIGFIDGYQFYDEKVGIKLLTEANKLIYDCNFMTSSIRERIEALKKEIAELKKLGKDTVPKTLELTKIEEDLKFIQSEKEKSRKKRHSILVEPIEKRIQTKLELFAIQNGYKKIFNVLDYEDSILYIDQSILITTEFIKFCNEEFEKEKLQNK